MEPKALLAHLRDEVPAMTASLEALVQHESPTANKAAVDRLSQFVGDFYRRAGVQVEVLRREHCGDHLRVTFGEGPEQVLILAHLDTVWPVGTVKERPFRVEGPLAYGPGVNDDKGGVLIAMWAVQTMARLGLKPSKRVVILHNADEEGGSLDSRALIAEEAARSSHVLVLETSTDDGAVKTARRGGFTFTLTAQGRAAHAGNDLKNGINAIEELAHHVVTLQRLTDYDRGIGMNVGAIEGGGKAGVVPAQASLRAYVRAWTPADFNQVVDKLHSLKPVLPGASLSVTMGPTRPPFERTEQVAALFEQTRTLAAEMGLELREAAAGAGSDGNLAAATGTPVLDGLGPVGCGAHALHEQIDLDRLPERTALLIRLLQTL